MGTKRNVTAAVAEMLAAAPPRRSTRNRKAGTTEVDSTSQKASNDHGKSQLNTSEVQVSRKRNNSDVVADSDTESTQVKPKRPKPATTKASKPKASAPVTQPARKHPLRAPDYDEESGLDDVAPLPVSSKRGHSSTKPSAVTSNTRGPIPTSSSMPANKLREPADASTEESNESDKQSGDDSSELSESDDDDLRRLLNNGPKALGNALANERAIWTDETTVRTPSNDEDHAGSHLPSKIVRKTAQAKAGTRPRQSDWEKRSAEQPVWTDDARVQPETTSTSKSPSHGRKVSRSSTSPAAVVASRDATLSLSPANPTSDDVIAAALDVPMASPTDSDDSIELVLPPNGTKLHLNDQHERVARLLRSTIVKVQLDLVFENAFPEQPLQQVVVPNALIAVARGLKDTELTTRISNDQTYRRALSRIPAQRVSNFRGDFKKKTDALVDGYYHCNSFRDAGELQKAIDWLKEEGMYHYPCDAKLRTVEANKPFQHPIMESAFKQILFQKPSSFGFLHCIDLCESSLPDKPDEKELPMAMVALVATAVYASLNNWAHGTCKTTEFEMNLVCNAYKTNIALLEAIKNKSAKKYHTLMHGLFKKASGQVDVRQKGKSSAVERALQILDIDAMADSDMDN